VWSVVDRNVVMRRMTVQVCVCVFACVRACLWEGVVLRVLGGSVCGYSSVTCVPTSVLRNNKCIQYSSQTTAILFVIQHQNAGLWRDEELFSVFVDFHSSAVEVFLLWEVALLHWVFGLRRFEAMWWSRSVVHQTPSNAAQHVKKMDTSTVLLFC
jgi:hypothetical protein